MQTGHPLTDEDRIPWLKRLNSLSLEQAQLNGAIIACSALKEKYRQILSSLVPQPIWILLKGPYSLIADRIKKRAGHFMPLSLLRSQFETLEIPSPAFCVDIDNDPEKIIARIIGFLKDKHLV